MDSVPGPPCHLTPMQAAAMTASCWDPGIGRGTGLRWPWAPPTDRARLTMTVTAHTGGAGHHHPDGDQAAEGYRVPWTGLATAQQPGAGVLSAEGTCTGRGRAAGQLAVQRTLQLPPCRKLWPWAPVPLHLPPSPACSLLAWSPVSPVLAGSCRVAPWTPLCPALGRGRCGGQGSPAGS